MVMSQKNFGAINIKCILTGLNDNIQIICITQQCILILQIPFVKSIPSKTIQLI